MRTYIVTARHNSHIRMSGTTEATSASQAVGSLETRLARDGDTEEEIASYAFSARPDTRTRRVD